MQVVLSSSVVVESVYLTVTDVMAMPTVKIGVMNIIVSFLYILVCYYHSRAIGVGPASPALARPFSDLVALGGLTQTH